MPGGMTEGSFGGVGGVGGVTEGSFGGVGGVIVAPCPPCGILPIALTYFVTAAAALLAPPAMLLNIVAVGQRRC